MPQESYRLGFLWLLGPFLFLFACHEEGELRSHTHEGSRTSTALSSSLVRPLSEELKVMSQALGSQAIIEACWTRDNLEGTSNDKKIHVLPQPDLTPPTRLFPSHSLSPLPEAYRGVIRSVRLASPVKRIALTFDLCELADRITGYDRDIVNALRKHAVRATFFAGGKWMRSHPQQAMQLIADPLFEIGNHGWSHGNLGVMSLDKIKEQINWTQAQYEILREEIAKRAANKALASGEMDKIPAVPQVFRLPYGRCRPESLEILAEMGLSAIQWDVVGEENSEAFTPQQLAKDIAKRSQSGSIILLHANAVPKKTALIVPYLVQELRAQGYTFVTVSELLRSGKPQAFKDGYFIEPGDNLRYDVIYGDGTTRPSKP